MEWQLCNSLEREHCGHCKLWWTEVVQVLYCIQHSQQVGCLEMEGIEQRRIVHFYSWKLLGDLPRTRKVQGASRVFLRTFSPLTQDSELPLQEVLCYYIRKQIHEECCCLIL